MPARIRDVAELAGVSTATVSHVINGTRRVSPETREKVETAIKELNYRPSAVARGLRTKNSHSIALVVPNVLNHFFGAIAVGIEEWLQAEGYSLIVCNTLSSSERESDHIKMLISHRVGGVIIAPAGNSSANLEGLFQFNIPVVLIDKDVKGFDAPCVQTDHAQATKTAAEHLLADGYKRIVATVETAQVKSPAIRARLYGFRQALRVRRECRAEVVVLDSEAGRALADLLAEDIPTAILTTNYQASVRTLALLSELGVHYPRDIGFLAFDDSEWAPLVRPALSCVRQPVASIAAKAAEVLLERIKGEESRSEYVFPAELVVRASCSKACERRWEALLAGGSPGYQSATEPSSA